ncbi:MAG: polyphosphate kinase [Bacteroidia bacterium]|nr:polyphosphate kinase [Bacteroidia bacterium]
MNKIKLKTINTKAPEKINKEEYKLELDKILQELFGLQHLFYASHKYSLLIIFQGIDTAGKDSTIRQVFSGVNPLGVHATSFKAPIGSELEHDYMWRIFQKLPEKGMIQIFNRSYYEDILVPTIQKTHPNNIIEDRYDFINAFEKHLQSNNTIILKFFLHISEDEQKKRIQERMNDPFKKWKYSEGDLQSSKKWKEYKKVYEQILNRCSSELPWVIVPADNKWYRNYIVASTIVAKLKHLKLKFPKK